jgi:putative acetyltransferase
MQTIEHVESASSMTVPELSIRPLRIGDDASPFRRLNEEWITRFFILEAKDIAMLGDPESEILAKGGQIYFVHCGDEVVGCVALIPMNDGVYELSKMAVAPKMRGLGIGRKLLEYTIAQARQRGASSLFLGSSKKLQNAVHLYESLGFRHVEPDTLPDMHYSRADVFMTLTL